MLQQSQYSYQHSGTTPISISRLSSSPITGPPSPLEKATATLCIAIFCFPLAFGKSYDMSVPDFIILQAVNLRVSAIITVNVPCTHN